MSTQKIIDVKIKTNEVQQFIFILLLLGIYLLSSPAFAQTAISGVLCSAFGLLAFDVGRALATLTVITLGVGAMLGRVTWGQAVTALAGAAATVGAIVLSAALLPTGALGLASDGLCGIKSGGAQALSTAASIVWFGISLR